MTVAEMKKVMETLPDDMNIFMFIDEENVVSVSEYRSDIEEVLVEYEQRARVFVIRPGHVTDGSLRIPKTIINN
jgi:hypothetical protein